MDLSIIIPVYNEAHKIIADLSALKFFLSSQGLKAEVIVVDDGSDDKTVAVVKDFIDQGNTFCRLMGYQPNKGKGHAVRQGVAEAGGDVIMFVDSGNCVPFDNIIPALRMIKNGTTDIAHGSRFMKESRIMIPRSYARKFYSAAFRLLIRLLFQQTRKLTDTQCGLKVYRHDVAKKIYAECKTNGFLFDIDTIVRAGRYGFRITEFPLEWTPDPDSRLYPLRFMFLLIPELFSLRKFLRG